MKKSTVYVVWMRGDGYVAATAGGIPRSTPGDALNTFTELLRSEDWDGCRSRIRAERTAAVMNEDLFPIAPSAEGNRDGVTLSGNPW